MSFHSVGGGMADFAPVSYSGGRLFFRGPAPDRNRPFAAFLGGSATFGSGVPDPFPSRVARALGLQCLNLGVNQAGPDVILHEGCILSLARDAERVIIQAPSVRNVTTDYVQVHPRRNDRVVRVKEPLRDLLPRQSWINVHFTGHLDEILAKTAPAALEAVVQARERVWLKRMQHILACLPNVSVVVAGPAEVGLATKLHGGPVLSCKVAANVDVHDAYTDTILRHLQ